MFITLLCPPHPHHTYHPITPIIPSPPSHPLPLSPITPSPLSPPPHRYGHVECVQTLLTEGNCSPSLTTQADSTVLHLAARKGRVEVVQLLLSHPNINIVGSLDWSVTDGVSLTMIHRFIIKGMAHDARLSMYRDSK